MLRTLLTPIAALAICASGVFAAAAPAEPPAPAAMAEQHWAADRAAMLDARLAGLKAGLKLTPDQEKLWPPFDAAVRDATKQRMDQMMAMVDRVRKMRDMAPQPPDANRAGRMMDMSQPGPAVSPLDRLEAMAQHMTDRGAALKKFADAAKPLYASLDESQKRLFSMLGGEMLVTPHGHPGMGMMGRNGDMMGAGCMSRERMMGPGGMMGSERMRGPGPSQDDDDYDDGADED